MKWWDQIPWSSFSKCWALSQHFHSLTFIKRLFSSSLSAIRVVSSAYLKLLILLSAILNPAFAYSSPAFLMMYSAYKLNKQGDNIQPWHTPFPIWNQSVVPCPVLTVVSWHAYTFLKRKVRWSGIPISFRIFQFIVIHTVKGFGVVNKAEIGGSVVSNSPVNAGDAKDMGSILGLGRSPGEGNGNPLQHACLENSMDRGAWWATIPWSYEGLDTIEHACKHFSHL